jgi:hypothetical protein
MTKAVEGALVNGHSDQYIISAANVAAASFFGRACLAVTGFGDRFVQPTTAAGVFIGILVHSHAVEQSQVTAGAAGLPVNKTGGVLRRGRIWVVTETAITDITVGVFYRHTTSGALPEALGRFRVDADTADATQVTAARWLGTASAGGLVQLEINLP